MHKRDFDIAILFAGFLAGHLTEDQQAELEAWIVEAEENRKLFERVCGEGNFGDLHRMASRYDKQKAWQKVGPIVRPEKKIAGRRQWLAWTAILVLPVCIGYFLLQEAEPQDDLVVLNHAVQVRPGGPKAILTLADGAVVDLEEVKAFQMQEKDGTQIEKDSVVLSYRNNTRAASATEEVYNKIETPRGGEYSLVLSDGTVVYLNAMSELRFPVNFVGEKREVELSGEAYFEVQKDASRPFIVRTGGLQIKVLGTEFNVCAYREKKSIKTTLVQGSVELSVQGEGQSVVLRPNQQAKFSKKSGNIKVKEVDVSSYIAWKNGMFDIRDWELEDIMEYLMRWYDINVFYQHESLKKMRFGCYINRYSDIRPVLELLEKTGKIHTELKGNTVVFSTR